MVRPLTTAIDKGTHAYVLNSLLGGVIPLAEAIPLLVDCIDRNRTEWVRFMAEQKTLTWFAYDVSWIVSTYLNACILASTAAAEGVPGVCTLVLFHYLTNELNHSRYTGRALRRSLQDLSTARAGRREDMALTAALPPPAPRTGRQAADSDSLAAAGKAAGRHR